MLHDFNLSRNIDPREDQLTQRRGKNGGNRLRGDFHKRHKTREVDVVGKFTQVVVVLP